MKEKKSVKITVSTFIWILVFVIVLSIFATCLIMFNFLTNNQDKNLSKTNLENTILNNSNSDKVNTENYDEVKILDEEYKTSMFDLMFLKLENEKTNKIYSPLSIKYALKMLEEGAEGETKEQISKLIGDINLKKYISNSNFSFANSFFIRDSYKENVKINYIETLKNKYDAEVKFDTFENSNNINNWIKEKTLDIIPNIVQDDDVKELDFALINALAIDMEWKEKFLCLSNDRGYEITYFLHEKRSFDKELDWEEQYPLNINVYGVENVSAANFDNGKEELEVSGMEIYASINNYDIISDLGEEYIKTTVSEEYRKFAKGEEYDTDHAYGDFPLSEDVSDSGIEKALDEFLPGYIEDLKGNYHKLGATTEFSIYTDDNVKVFAKDLKEYEGTTLQYIGIMPVEEELDKFVEEIDKNQIENYVSNLKDVEDYKNFKEGVLTRIYGYIPKFKFEYNLELLEDLKKVGVTNIFDSETADLSNMIQGDAYIETALHKANIEFTQDGIKAAAVTMMGGLGAGTPFDYEFDIPCEDIDMTFDKPYMFLIQDKETGEIWFTGTVYEPLPWAEDPENYEY